MHIDFRSSKYYQAGYCVPREKLKKNDACKMQTWLCLNSENSAAVNIAMFTKSSIVIYFRDIEFDKYVRDIGIT